MRERINYALDDLGVGVVQIGDDNTVTTDVWNQVLVRRNINETVVIAEIPR
jgi:hypothetical protein